jgi:membrane-associated phospholipid phosphatase
MRLSAFLCSLLVWCVALVARAEPTATPRVELRHDDSADLFVTGAVGYLDLMAEVELNRDVAAKKCRWCKPPNFDEDAREALKWKNTKAAATAGTITGFVVSPVLAVGLTSLSAFDDGRGDEAPLDALLIAEAATTAIGITEVAKQTFARARPAVYYHSEGWPDYSAREQNVSFFSGHSSLAFSLAVSAGTVSTMRGYRLAPLVWSLGLPLATFTAYSRIAADAHYLSDVVTGSLVGAGVGFAVPYVFHPPLATESSFTWRPVVTPTAGGAIAGVAGRL